MVRDLTVLLAGLLLGMVAAYTLSWHRSTPSPRASGWCEPAVATVGDPIVCHDLSQYAEGIRWLFGDGAASEIRPGWAGRVEHVYRAPGLYTVHQEAFAGEALDTRRFEVRVLDPDPLPEPIVLSVRGVLPESEVMIMKTHTLREVQDEHPEGPNSVIRHYERRFTAESGFKITGTKLQLRATQGMTRFRSSVSDDGSEAVIRFSLRSGPKADPTRGWLIGDLILTQEGRSDDRQIDVARDFLVARAGGYSLDRVDLSGVLELRVLDEAGNLMGRGLPGEAMVLDGRGVSVMVETTEARTLLTITNH